jgi:hypothetical protein
MKRRRAARAGRKTNPRAVNERLEALLKDFLTKVTTAAYQVALKTGFRGSFITFLSDLQEALESVIQQDRRTPRRARPEGFHPVALH